MSAKQTEILLNSLNAIEMTHSYIKPLNSSQISNSNTSATYCVSGMRKRNGINIPFLYVTKTVKLNTNNIAGCF
jgi:hypothetical protein